MAQGAAVAWPDHLLDLADWEAVDLAEGHRAECAEGVLVVTPRPGDSHQRAAMRLAWALDAVLPRDVDLLLERELVITADHPPTVRIPDIMVVDRAMSVQAPSRYPRAAVRLAVEVISPGSRRTDTVTKMSEYAEAGIAEYWVLDPEAGPELAVFDLADSGQYVLRERCTGQVEVRACGATVRLDLDTVAAPR